MIRIVNDRGDVMELAKGQVITYEKNNPLFNDADTFFQDISYPALAPISANNDIFFQFGRLIERDTQYYVMPATFFADEILLAAGNVKFRIGPDGYEINLQPNLTAVNYLIKNVYLPDVKTSDGDYTSATNPTDFNALMLDTVVNPDKHNYIFVPILNGHLGPTDSSYSYINYYQFDDLFGDGQYVFFSERKPGAANPFWLANAPFFKLTYILKQLAVYLGFTPVGSLFTDPKYKNLLIYTQFCFDLGYIYPCMRYMPYILISDFLKFIRERFHISFDFDLAAGELSMETFYSIKRKAKAFDLTPYLIGIIEQELPDQAGYTVTLKLDPNDAKFPRPPANFQLIVGDGSNEIELDCGTLSNFSIPGSGLEVDQLMNNFAFNMAGPDGLIDNFPLNGNFDPGSGNTWPLRVFNYTGYISNMPKAAPVDLSSDDVEYYQFLNDSKRLIIPVAMPAAVLGKLKITDKYCLRTEGYNYRYLILEKISYDAGLDTDLIQAKIYARVIDFEVVTPAAITVPTSRSDPGTAPGFPFKAYFDPIKTGISSLTLKFYRLDEATLLKTLTITSPTNFKGSGGIGVIYFPDDILDTYELHISQGSPKYIEWHGDKIYFTQEDGYSKVIFSVPQYAAGIFDWIWISF